MATSSFFQNVVVNDKQKADEVKSALESGTHTYADIPPAAIDYEKQRKEAKKWCLRLNGKPCRRAACVY